MWRPGTDLLVDILHRPHQLGGGHYAAISQSRAPTFFFKLMPLGLYFNEK